jgi:hypothetical protein
MDNVAEVQALTDAIRILADSRCELAGGPIRPWNFIYDAGQHLQKRLNEVTYDAMESVFGDPESVTA